MGKTVDLRSRVTGQPARPLGTPPPAKPQVAKARPLGVGQAVPATAGESTLTAMEQAALRATAQLPQHIQAQAQAIRVEEAQQPMIPPQLPDGYKPVETVDITQLEPATRARVLHNIQEVQKAHTTPKAAPPQEPPSVASQAVPGWRSPHQGGSFYQPPAPAQEPPPNPSGRPELLVDVDVDLLTPKPAGTPPPQPPAPAPAADEEDEAGVNKAGECPHCGFDLSQEAVPEPSYHEKQAFLQAMLGQKPFVKTYTPFDSKICLTFRTLTTREVDKIYAQVLQESRAGQVPTPLDYWERINRYRLYLQLVRLELADGVIDLPAGFTPATNPHADSHWELPQSDDKNYTGLTAVDEYINSDVLCTETLQRVAQNACAQFNRLVSKLEALMDHKDFWRKTEEQS